MSGRNAQLVGQALEAHSARDQDRLKRLIAAGATLSAGVWDARGMHVDETHEDGNAVVLIGRVAAPGSETETRMAFRWEVRDGMIRVGQSYPDPGEALREAGLADSTGRNVQLIRRHYEAYNRDDLDAVVATLHPEAELYGGDERGGAGERFSGRDDVRRFFTEVKRLVIDNTIEVLTLEATPGRVESSVRLRGTLREQGLSGEVPGVHFFTFRDGLISRIETFRPHWRPGI